MRLNNGNTMSGYTVGEVHPSMTVPEVQAFPQCGRTTHSDALAERLTNVVTAYLDYHGATSCDVERALREVERVHCIGVMPLDE